jgi:hypothetical protein
MSPTTTSETLTFNGTESTLDPGRVANQ